MSSEGGRQGLEWISRGDLYKTAEGMCERPALPSSPSLTKARRGVSFASINSHRFLFHRVAAGEPLSWPRCHPLWGQQSPNIPSPPPQHPTATGPRILPPRRPQLWRNQPRLDPREEESPQHQVPLQPRHRSQPHTAPRSSPPASHRGAPWFSLGGRGGSRKEPRRKREAGTNTPGLCQKQGSLTWEQGLERTRSLFFQLQVFLLHRLGRLFLWRDGRGRGRRGGGRAGRMGAGGGGVGVGWLRRWLLHLLDHLSFEHRHG